MSERKRERKRESERKKERERESERVREREISLGRRLRIPLRKYAHF